LLGQPRRSTGSPGQGCFGRRALAGHACDPYRRSGGGTPAHAGLRRGRLRHRRRGGRTGRSSSQATGCGTAGAGGHPPGPGRLFRRPSPGGGERCRVTGSERGAGAGAADRGRTGRRAGPHDERSGHRESAGEGARAARGGPADMRHAVLGAGGVGALVAAALPQDGQDVLLLLRPETLEEYAGGLHVESRVLGEIEVDVPATARLGRPVDVLWVTVKATQLDGALEIAAPAVA